jgi:hypothetical protein
MDNAIRTQIPTSSLRGAKRRGNPESSFVISFVHPLCLRIFWIGCAFLLAVRHSQTSLPLRSLAASVAALRFATFAMTGADENHVNQLIRWLLSVAEI